MRSLVLLWLTVTVLTAIPARGAEWTYESMDSICANCVVADPVHGRVFVGTREGFHYLDIPSGIWTSRDWEGWIGREVHAIAWHEDLEERVITGRVNAFFKGYIELSDDLGLTEQLVYSSNGGAVNGIVRDALDADRYYACTWQDVAPGEIVRSRDGGENWTLLTGTIHFAMTSIDVDPANTIYVAGDQRVTRSFNGGDSWEPAWNGLPAGYGIYCVAANPEVPGHVLAANDLGLYETFDSGDNWVPSIAVSCRKIAWGWSWASIPDPGTDSGQLVGLATWDGRILLSQNAGATWVDETGDLPGEPVDLAFSLFDEGLYAATTRSGVFRTMPMNPASLPVDHARAGQPRLTCPRPFAPGAALSFRTRRAGDVALEILDVTGRKEATLISGWLESGDYQVAWDTDLTGGGIYFARLRTAEGTSGVRIALIK
jgi:hypothetical protein